MRAPARWAASVRACHVVQGAGAVVDVAEHEDGGVGVQVGFDLVALDGADGVAGFEELGEAVGDVEVGGEVAGLGQDGAAVGAEVEAGGEQFVEVDGGGVGGEHRVRGGAQEAGELVADALGLVDPVGVVPGADEAPAPLVFDGLGEAGWGGAREGAEGVAVQVEDFGREDELVAEGGEGVLGVELLQVGAGDGGHLGPGGWGRTPV